MVDWNKAVVGFLILLVSATAIYISLGDVKLRVDNDKSTFYVKNENNRWVVSGREYNSLFDGSSKMNRRTSLIKRNITIDNVSNTVTITRETPYIRGPIIKDTYFFEGNIDDIELFPINHKIEIINGSGYFFRYEVRDLSYEGISYKLSGETQLSFGLNMKVELHPNYRWAWVYKDGIVKAQYDILTDYEVFNVRLFDPLNYTYYCATEFNSSIECLGGIYNKTICYLDKSKSIQNSSYCHGGWLNASDYIEYFPEIIDYRTSMSYFNPETKQVHMIVGQHEVKYEGKWILPETAPTLKGNSGFECVVTSDDKHFVKCLDYNFTHKYISFNLNRTKISDKNIPIKIYEKKFNSTSKKYDINQRTDSYKNLSVILESNFWIKSNFTDEIHIGENSTTVILQSNITDNLDDAYIEETDAGSNFGTSDQLRSNTGSDEEYSLLKFNKSITRNQGIVDASLNLYAWLNQLDAGSEGYDISTHLIYDNFSWIESTITYNTRPTSGSNYSPTSSDTITVTGDTPIGWFKWNVTSILKEGFDLDNISIYLFVDNIQGSPSTSDDIIYRSKEWGNGSRQPFLNITFEPMNLTYIINDGTLVFDVSNMNFIDTVSTVDKTIELASGKTTGNLTSQIFDLSVIQIYNNISWVTEVPYQAELPNNQDNEYPCNASVRCTNMTGNVLLMHLNIDESPQTDSSGTGNTGTVNGATFNSSGKLNGAYDFDGNDDWINIGNKASLNFDGTTPFSISAWVKREGTGAAHTIIAKNDGLKGWYFWFRAGNQLAFYIRVDATTNHLQVRTSQTFTDATKWIHVVATYDGSQSASGTKIYIDGVNVSLFTEGDDLSTSIANTGSARIGTISDGTSDYIGLIDELAVWNRTLSATEVLDMYKRSALRLNLTVRSCDDENCSGETFNDTVDTSPILNLNDTVPNNRYFQYKFQFETEDLSVTTQLYNVTLESTPLDLTPPSVSIAPINITTTNSSIYWNITFNEASNMTGTYGIAPNYSGTGNFTNTSTLTTLEINITGLTNLTEYGFNITSFCDNSGNCNTSGYIFNFTTFSNPPIPIIITILNPVNNTVYETSSVDLNWTININPDWCAYSLDGGANDTEISKTVIFRTNATNVSYTPSSSWVAIDIEKNGSLSAWQIDNYDDFHPSGTFWGNDLFDEWDIYLVDASTVSFINKTQATGDCLNNCTAISFDIGGPANISLKPTEPYTSNNQELYLFNISIMNITLTNLSEGLHNVTIYCNDTLNNIGQSDYTYFTVQLDTCSCPSINENWEIDMSDFCNITTDCDIGTGLLNFTGSGITRFNATINAGNFSEPGNASRTLLIDSNCYINITS